jgi:hypothetical protein
MTLNLKYNWVKTCDASPEQYDVFDKDGKQIAYVRARWSRITVDCPDAMENRVFDEQFTDTGWDGCFEDDEHRARFFPRIEEAIDKFYDEKGAIGGPTGAIRKAQKSG